MTSLIGILEMDLLTETLKMFNSNYYTCHYFHPFTFSTPLSPPPHLPYHLSLSDLQLLLVLTINIPSSISPRSVKKIACDTVILVTNNYGSKQKLLIKLKQHNYKNPNWPKANHGTELLHLGQPFLFQLDRAGS